MDATDGIGYCDDSRIRATVFEEAIVTATYTFDVFMTLDGFGSYSTDGDWGGYWGKQGPEFLANRLASMNEEQRLVIGAATFRQFMRLLDRTVLGDLACEEHDDRRGEGCVLGRASRHREDLAVEIFVTDGTHLFDAEVILEGVPVMGPRRDHTRNLALLPLGRRSQQPTRFCSG